MGNCASPCAGSNIVGQPAIPMDLMNLESMQQERLRLQSMSESEKRQYINNEMMNRELTSGIMLDAIFFLSVPASTKGAYKLDFKMNYSVFSSKWTEDKLRNKNHKSRPC